MREPELERLRRAMRVNDQFLAEGGGPDRRAALLAQHPDLRDLLEPLLAGDGDADESTAPDAAGARPATGSRLGDFELGRELGRGGMGIVYQAVQVSLGRPVAIKILHPGLVLDPRARRRFVREARLAASLDHRAITKVISADADGEVAYYAMERVDGASLDRVLRRLAGVGAAEEVRGRDFESAVRATLDAAPPAGGGERDDAAGSDVTPVWDADHVTVAVRIAAEVASALQHAHDRGVVHRDVKPANILVRRDGSVALTDFGLAREFGLASVTATGEIVGTPCYSAPEQIAGSHAAVDGRTDVFSLGVTLYELLTLRRPFEADTAVEVRQRIVTKEPARPHRVNRRVPRDLSAIVQKALEKDPDRRYGTAVAFADDLRAVLAGRPVAARPVPTHVVLWRWTRRNPLAAGALGLLLALAAALGALAQSEARAAERQRLAAIAEDLEAGRLLSQIPDALAEPRLWRAHRARPDRATHWALVGLYRRFHVRRTLGHPADPIVGSGFAPDGERFVTLSRAGACTLWDGGVAEPIAHCSLTAEGAHEGLTFDHERVYLLLPGGEIEVASWGTDRSHRVLLDVDDTCISCWGLGADDRWRGVVGLDRSTPTAVCSWGRDGGDRRTELELPEGTLSVQPLVAGECLATTAPGELWWLSGGDQRRRILTDRPRGLLAFPVAGSRDFWLAHRAGVRRLVARDGEWHEAEAWPVHGTVTHPLPDGRLAAMRSTQLTVHGPGGRERVTLDWMHSNVSWFGKAGLAARYPDGSIRVWDVATIEPRQLAVPAGTQHAVCFDGERSFWCGGMEQGQTSPAGAIRRVAIGPQELGLGQHVEQPAMVTGIAVSPDRRRVAVGLCASPAVRVFARDGEALGDGDELDAGTEQVSFVAFSHGGGWLAASDDDQGRVALWPQPFTGAGRRLLAADTHRFAAVAFAGDDRLLAAGGSAIATFFLEGGEPRLERLWRREADSFRCVTTWRQDGAWFAAAGGDRGMVYTWRVADPMAEPRAIVVTSGNPVYAVASGSFRGEWLLACADSLGVVQLLDTASGRPLCVLRSAQRGDGATNLLGLAFSSDGELLVATGEPNVAIVFRLGYAHDFVAGNEARAAFCAAADEGQR